MVTQPLHTNRADILTERKADLDKRRIERPLEALRALAHLRDRPSVGLLSTVMSPDEIVLLGGIRYTPSAYDPVGQALFYASRGLDGIGFFTDDAFYQHPLEDLALLTTPQQHLPVVYQNYIFDAYQIFEARAGGAAAVTLDVDLVDAATLRDLISLIGRSCMSAVVRVATPDQIAQAVALSPAALDIVRRDPVTEALDADWMAALRDHVPPTVRVLISSRLRTFEEAYAVARLRPHAVMVSQVLLSAHFDAIPRLRTIFAGG